MYTPHPKNTSSLKKLIYGVFLCFYAMPIMAETILAKGSNRLNAEISTETIWDARHSPVIIPRNLSIKKGGSLTILPGVVVKTASKHGAIVVYDGGALVVKGVANNPVVFTSINDLSVDGYTGYPHEYTEPTKSDWKGINFLKNSKGRISNLEIKYSGKKINGASINIQSGNVSVKNSKISDGYGAAISLHGSACSSIIEKNTFIRNEINTVVLNSCQIKQDTVFDNDIYVSKGLFTVSKGTTLRIKDDVIIKFDSKGKMRVSGRLVADGLPNRRVIFTSIKDDSIGNDINNDGFVNLPKTKDWSGIEFTKSSSGSWLNNTDIRYAGYNARDGASILTYTSKLILNSLNITHSENAIIKNDLYTHGKVIPTVINSKLAGYPNNVSVTANASNTCQAPDHKHFLKTPNPSCSQEWDYHNYLSEGTKIFDIKRQIVTSTRNGSINAHLLMQLSIDIGSSLASIFQPNDLSGMAINSGIELQKALVIYSIDQKSSGLFSSLLKDASLIAYQIAIDYSFKGTVNLYPILATKVLHLSNHTQARYKEDNFIEDFNDFTVTQEYLWSLYKYGSSYSLLADSLNLPLNVPLKELIKVLAEKNDIKNKFLNREYRFDSVKDEINYFHDVIGMMTTRCSIEGCKPGNKIIPPDPKEGRKAIIEAYYKQFKNEVFLTPRDDDSNHLKGQCVAGAKAIFNELSAVKHNQSVNGKALNMQYQEYAEGFNIVKDSTKPVIGAMVVWDDGGSGHLGIVSDISNGKLTVIESNWGESTELSQKKWSAIGDKTITENYGRYTKKEFAFPFDNLDRVGKNTTYKFAAYVYPK